MVSNADLYEELEKIDIVLDKINIPRNLLGCELDTAERVLIATHFLQSARQQLNKLHGEYSILQCQTLRSVRSATPH